MANPTQEQIEKALKRDKTNLRQWALSREYPYTTVYNTVSRWAGRSDRTPHGGEARRIMKDMCDFVGTPEVRNLEGKVANQSCELAS